MDKKEKAKKPEPVMGLVTWKGRCEMCEYEFFVVVFHGTGKLSVCPYCGENGKNVQYVR